MMTRRADTVSKSAVWQLLSINRRPRAWSKLFGKARRFRVLSAALKPGAAAREADYVKTQQLPRVTQNPLEFAKTGPRYNPVKTWEDQEAPDEISTWLLKSSHFNFRVLHFGNNQQNANVNFFGTSWRAPMLIVLAVSPAGWFSCRHFRDAASLVETPVTRLPRRACHPRTGTCHQST
jgi:hypothetical protein